MYRHPFYPLSGRYETDDSFVGARGTHSRWPFDGARIHYFSWGPLFVDISLFVLLTFGTWYATPRLTALLITRRTFSVRTLFLITTLFAIAAALGGAIWNTEAFQNFLERAFGASVPTTTKVRYSFQFTAIAINLIAALLTMFSISHAFFRFLSSRRSRSASSSSPAGQLNAVAGT
jgi:hypothetical protein